MFLICVSNGRHHYELHDAKMVVSCMLGALESKTVLAKDLEHAGYVREREREEERESEMEGCGGCRVRRRERGGWRAGSERERKAETDRDRDRERKRGRERKREKERERESGGAVPHTHCPTSGTQLCILGFWAHPELFLLHLFHGSRPRDE